MKKTAKIIIFCILMLLFISFAASAGNSIYVNDASSPLAGLIADAYAIGAYGKARIGHDDVRALTANGLVRVGNSMGEGGGGLLYDDGSVTVGRDRLRIGLRYYYSNGRDSSMESANLENAIGRGYAFGRYDETGCFVQASEDAWTDEKQITMRPLLTEDGEVTTGVGVYATGTGELLYSVEASDRDHFLAVHPLSDDGDAVTWFAGRRYYGDFAYAVFGKDKLTVVNIVDIEHYIMGVCAGEMGGSFPKEALKAQAVAARSYAINSARSGVYALACGFDLTNDDYCQVYLGYTDSAVIRSAVMETANQYLTYNHSIISALYFAADGGETLDSEEVFPNALQYLRGVEDPYEAAAWTKEPYGHRVGLSQWGAYAMAKYYNKDYKDILGFYYTKVGLSYGENK